MGIDISPELDKLIHACMKEGDYQTPQEVIHAGVRLLHAIESREKLRRDIQAGIAEADRGELEPLDINDILAEVEAEAGGN